MITITLTSESVLCLNPALVVSPAHQLAVSLCDESGELGPCMVMPIGAIRVLRAFTRPQKIKDVFGAPTSEGLNALRDSIAKGFLLLQNGGPNADSRAASLHDGFRLADYEDDNPEWHRLLTRHVRVAGKSIFVLDGLLSFQRTRAVQRWLVQLPYRLNDIDSARSASFRHWISVLSSPAEYCEAVPLFARLEQAAAALFRTRRLRVIRAHAYAVPYGDVQFAHSDFDSGKGVTIVLFANTQWPEEWQAEMLFFGRSGEPEIAVAPRPGRVIIFRGDIKHRAGTPPRFCNEARFTLVMRLTLPN